MSETPSTPDEEVQPKAQPVQTEPTEPEQDTDSDDNDSSDDAQVGRRPDFVAETDEETETTRTHTHHEGTTQDE